MVIYLILVIPSPYHPGSDDANIFQRPVRPVGLNPGNAVNHLHTLYHLSEDRIVLIEMGCTSDRPVDFAVRFWYPVGWSDSQVSLSQHSYHIPHNAEAVILWPSPHKVIPQVEQRLVVGIDYHPVLGQPVVDPRLGCV